MKRIKIALLVGLAVLAVLNSFSIEIAAKGDLFVSGGMLGCDGLSDMDCFIVLPY